MAALGSLIEGDLPPVGNPISLRSDASGSEFCSPLNFPGYQSITLGSGTMSLALAMMLIKDRCSHIHRPEVILPAYGCPDLVAAAVHAGLRPVLVDIEESFHGFNLLLLAAAFNEYTVAIVAVNFLGVPERLDDIREMMAPWPSVFLIEDNAQWFPELNGEQSLSGDYVCLSFGRGKPVSLLGGGALFEKNSIVNQSTLESYSPAAEGAPAFLKLKLRAYNHLLSPLFYQLLSRNPFIHLGQTQYKPLLSIDRMDGYRLSLLAANIECYEKRDRGVEVKIRKIVGDSSKYTLIDLTAASGAHTGRLLRFPILCADRETRNKLLGSLAERGLGASAMYRLPLGEIEGVGGLLGNSVLFQSAKNFADRLLTLPVHQGVTQSHLDRLERVMN